MTPGKPSKTDSVVRALVLLADAMQVEGLARKTYEGHNFDEDAKEKLNAVRERREVFERELRLFVDRLVRA